MCPCARVRACARACRCAGAHLRACGYRHVQRHTHAGAAVFRSSRLPHCRANKRQAPLHCASVHTCGGARFTAPHHRLEHRRRRSLVHQRRPPREQQPWPVRPPAAPAWQDPKTARSWELSARNLRIPCVTASGRLHSLHTQVRERGRAGKEGCASGRLRPGGRPCADRGQLLEGHTAVSPLQRACHLSGSGSGRAWTAPQSSRVLRPFRTTDGPLMSGT